MARRRRARGALLPRRRRRLHARGACGRRQGDRLWPRDLAAPDGARDARRAIVAGDERSEEHTSELQSLMRSSYAVFWLTKKKKRITKTMRKDCHKRNNKT